MSLATFRSKASPLLLPVLVIVLILLLWDWNWFKPLVERQATKALGRPVTIAHLHVQLGQQSTIELTGLTLANPEGFPADAAPLARIGQAVVQLQLRDLLDRRVQIVHLDINQPEASLRSGPDGLRNWQLQLPASEPNPKPWDLQIAALNVRDGRFSLIDPALKAEISGSIHTTEAAAGSEPQLLVEAKGRYDGAPFDFLFTGGSALSLREPSNPYSVDLAANSGDAHIALKGTLLDPLQFAGANLRLLLRGSNLATLSRLTRLPLPNTPAYRLEGRLNVKDRSILFQDFKGVMGESDLSGDVSVKLRKPRPLMQSTVRSKQLRLADLSGLIGGDPSNPAASATEDDGRLLPSTPISVPRLQAADVQLEFTGDSIQGDKLPFDRLAFKLSLDDGVMRVAPADFGIGQGALRFYATLDPRGEQLVLDGKAELRRIDISRLMADTGYKGSGRIGGFAALQGKGRSAAELLGSGNGELKLAMAGGNFSSLLLDLAGLDFGNATLSAIGISPRTEVRCMVGDFGLQDGQLSTRTFLLDTGNTNLVLDGGANFKDESLNLRLRTLPKRANIGRLKAPIHIRGSFSKPSIKPDLVDVGMRTAAAVVLGTFLTPLAALLPTLQFSPGEDRDCTAMLAQAEITPPPQPKTR